MIYAIIIRILCFPNGQGCPWFHTAAMFFSPQKTRVQELDKDVHSEAARMPLVLKTAAMFFSPQKTRVQELDKDVHSEKRHGCRWYYTAAMF
ncbi:hypothetical protein [Treponema sp.]|uniref:hypothetical protein n=1 Tax=Treponema sp. TaxID=166 RepID=UPI003FA3183E